DAKLQHMLSDLAASVMDDLELRRTAFRLRENEISLRENEISLRETLREKSELLVAVNKLTTSVIITNPRLPDNPIIFANQGFTELTGFALSEILGRNCRMLQGSQTDPLVAREMRQAVAEQRSFSGVLVNYRKDGTPFLNEIMINPVLDDEGELSSFVGLGQDVTQREQSRLLLEHRVEERTADLAHSQIEILQRLARAAEFRDDETGQHTQRVARTAALVASALGMPEETVTLIYQAAPLHDVGKIAISDLILLKPGKLTEEEFETMKTHAEIGAALLSHGHSEVMRIAERIAGTHHERWDGRGYPEQLVGEQIPIEGRILAVADVFDALTHERPYKEAWSIPEALQEITNQSGRHFDPKVVAAFLTLAHEELL
ncbi:HD domain-containing protein, partial [bacterium]